MDVRPLALTLDVAPLKLKPGAGRLEVYRSCRWLQLPHM